MYRPRIIPALLLKNLGLVKTINFSNPRYLGDPINAVKIFNDLKVDELIFLDILASKENREISIDFVKNVGKEANMPFAVGGGIKSLKNIKKIINAGAEKVILNTFANNDPSIIKESSEEFGSSTIVVSIDYKKSFFGHNKIYTYGGSKYSNNNLIEYAQKVESLGAGEIVINSISNDGKMQGYDIDTIKKVSESVEIPVVALGGAGKITDFHIALNEGNASAVAAGSMFVYHGSRNAVLINYLNDKEIDKFIIE